MARENRYKFQQDTLVLLSVVHGKVLAISSSALGIILFRLNCNKSRATIKHFTEHLMIDISFNAHDPLR